MKERNEMRCDVIYRCVSFIIDYQYFSEAVCKLCAMNFCVQRKSRYKSLCNGLISFVLCFVDQPGLTMGGAGHSKEIVKRLSDKGLFIGFDQDKNAIATAKERLSEYSDRVTGLIFFPNKRKKTTIAKR